MTKSTNQTSTHSPTQQAYSELEKAYIHFNDRLFNGKLPHCLIVLQRRVKTMGYVSIDRWISREGDKVHELAINPEYFLGSSIEEVFQTMVHEQCHVWQHTFGNPGRRGYHNREWSKKMESIGLIPSNTGWPGGKRTGEEMDDFILSDGAFHQAAKELLAKGFWLTWVDRMTANTTVRPLKVFTQAQIAEAESEEDGETFTPPSMTYSDETTLLSNECVTSSAEDDDEESSSVVVTCDFGQNEATVFLPVAAKIKKPPTRTKYRCGCDNLVWGRPNLKIVCAECTQPFVSVDPE
ncbi:hypothetical protein AB835_08210 [Candidatus Endobugula sertula]|uniref:SprT-like domain-containing protein n=1 Tax=Candidatus Endobugula sertula TaxID=62101 RepID=A0A1D2QPT5_9GAMM|nr:hypothetical protein AB835_08210 [Candidatus Endobugula sertula]